MGPAYAAADGLDAAVDFGNHSAGDNSLMAKFGHLAHIDNRDQRIFILFIAEQAADICHQDQLQRAELRRNAGSGDIRIDVVNLPLWLPPTVATIGI